jgi:hypothetical protein
MTGSRYRRGCLRDTSRSGRSALAEPTVVFGMTLNEPSVSSTTAAMSSTAPEPLVRIAWRTSLSVTRMRSSSRASGCPTDGGRRPSRRRRAGRSSGPARDHQPSGRTCDPGTRWIAELGSIRSPQRRTRRHRLIDSPGRPMAAGAPTPPGGHRRSRTLASGDGVCRLPVQPSYARTPLVLSVARIRLRARVSRRETCICEMPRSAAIWDWVRSP